MEFLAVISQDLQYESRAKCLGRYLGLRELSRNEQSCSGKI